MRKSIFFSLTFLLTLLALQSARASSFGTHLVGAFNVVNSAVPVAKRDGINFAVLYGNPPLPNSGSAFGRELAQSLNRSGIRVITAYVTYLVYLWECHRTWTVALPPRGHPNVYCSHDIDPGMGTSKLLDMVKKFSLRTANQSLIAGYWIRDDMPWWDEGHAGALLAEISTILPRGKPKICGFSAPLLKSAERGVGGFVGTGWIASGAADYSPQACDYVAPYVYSTMVKIGSNALNGFDWGLKNVLPPFLSALKKHGWTRMKSPLIGVTQAWGGRLKKLPWYKKVTPDEDSLRVQTAAFCKAGAQGIIFYAYSLSDFLDVQTPANNYHIEAGVRAGIQACESIWHGEDGLSPENRTAHGH